MAKLPQLSLSAGEISPSLYARTDLAKYRVALRTCKNFKVRHTGGVSNREGTEFVKETKNSGNPRLVPFKFNIEQAYLLEFGDHVVTLTAEGAPVPGPGSAINSMGLQIGGFPPAVLLPPRLFLNLATPVVGAALGATIYISGTNVPGQEWLNGTHTIIDFTSTSQFSIAGQNADFFSVLTPPGSVSVLLEIVSPYSAAEVDELKWTQSADVLILTHPDHIPYEFRRLSSTSFTLTAGVFEEGPFSSLNEIETLFVHSSDIMGTVTLTATQSIFQAGHVGALFYLEQRDASANPPWEPSRRITATGTNCFGKLRFSDQKNYECVTDYTPVTNEILTGTTRPTHDRGVAPDGNGEAITGGAEKAGVDWLYLDSGFGIFRITGFTSGTQVTATVLRQPPASVVGGATTSVGPFAMVGDGVTKTLAVAGATSGNPTKWEVTFNGVIQEFDLYSINATTDILTFYTAPAAGVAVSARQLSPNNRSDLWAFGAWSTVNGYPSEVEYFSDRIIYAATEAEPQTLWMSSVDKFSTFITSRPIIDDDPVTGTINAKEVNKVTDLVPLDSLLALTVGSEWRVTGGQDDVITPSSVGFKPQSFNGVTELPAKIIDDSALYIQNRSNHVRDLLQSISQDNELIFAGTDLSVMAEHLVENHSIVDWDYQSIPSKTIWMCRDDGTLLSLTYLKEHQVIGWSQHELGGSPKVLRVACIPEGDDEVVYMVVERVINGVTKRYLERMTNRRFTHVRDAIFLDSTLSYDGRNTSVDTMTLTGSGWTVSDELDLNSSTSRFSDNSVGDQIILAYGQSTELRLTITAYDTATHVSVTPSRNVPVEFQGIVTTDWALARDTFSGLGHMEGQEVMALADAGAIGPFTVSGESITIDIPAAVIHVGKSYNCDIETLDLVVDGGYIRGNAKNIPSVDLVVQETRGITAGPDADHLMEFKQRNTSDSYNTLNPMTGLAQIPIDCNWSKDARVFIRQSYPLPCTILSITPETKFGGSG